VRPPGLGFDHTKLTDRFQGRKWSSVARSAARPEGRSSDHDEKTAEHQAKRRTRNDSQKDRDTRRELGCSMISQDGIHSGQPG
jgi:hypothetical protein